MRKVDYNWEILYENIFNLRAYRVNLFIELRPGEGDDEIIWKIDWGDKKPDGIIFIIARRDQKWRGGFFSCNGFDAYVPRTSSIEFNLFKCLESSPFSS